MNATTIQLNESVAAFAAAVREQLDDLTAEQIEDLTDGLEADLVEGAVDRSGAFEPGDALEYASELRASAGLPPRVTNRSRRVSVTASIANWCADVARGIRSSAFGAGLLDFFVALRPVWWVLRGWAIFTGVATLLSQYYRGFFPDDVTNQLILLAVIVVSVQWGRGRWLPASWLRGLRTVSSVFAVLALGILGTGALVSAVSPPVSDLAPTDFGLWLDGERVGNIFAYDAAGQPLEFVQLFTQRGEPLTTVGHLESSSAFTWGFDGLVAPPRTSAGPTDWNVFPLFELNQRMDADPRYSSAPDGPFAQARPLAGAEGQQTCDAQPEESESAD